MAAPKLRPARSCARRASQAFRRASGALAKVQRHVRALCDIRIRPRCVERSLPPWSGHLTRGNYTFVPGRGELALRMHSLTAVCRHVIKCCVFL